ncbi:MAG: hypothetical protein ABSA44_01885 [Bacteroidota bacterium]|jgi:hypothetical protein
MLDLNELERKVDEAIAKDTPEEMMEWLLKKRMKEFSDFIPDGKVESLDNDRHITFANPIISSGAKSKESFVSSSQDLSRAA